MKNNFIIIIDMNSGGLISSLFRDNSFSSRSSSMFHKSILGGDNKELRARSQSVYMDKCMNNGSARMVHTLAVKVKKLNYFLFCRLQANLKKYKTNNIPLKNQQYIQNKTVQNHPSIDINITTSNNQNNKQQKITKGFQLLCEIFQLKQLKLQNQLQVQHAFNKIKNKSKNKQNILTVFKFLQRKYNINVTASFKKVQNYQKYVLKLQIFNDATVHVIQPKIKNIFKNIRQFAIQNKIKQQMRDRQIDKTKAQKFNNFQGFYLGNSRLKSITEQSSITSEEQISRFTTPEKTNKINLELQKSKTTRKQSKNLVLMRKQNIKQNYLSLQIQNYRSQRFNHIQNQDFVRSNSNMKVSTKKQSNRPRILIGKAYKIETALQDKNIIKISNLSRNNQKQECMLKHNRLYSQNLPQILPDLHDNMGVFESFANQQSNQTLSQRTLSKSKVYNPINESHKTASHCQQKIFDDVHKDDQIQLYQARHTENAYIKQSKKDILTENSRSLVSSFSSPKFFEAGINTRTRQQQRQNLYKNQFFTSPLQKIQEMIIDLQKLRQKQKFSSKYASGHPQKCKIAVNLPKKSCQGRSYQNSASKINTKTMIQQCRSQKKDSSNRLVLKQNKQQKQNIQEKLWDEKQKYLFYTQKKHSKQRKNTGLICSMNQSELNTARKMKKQIQNIIKNRKSRTSLGNLKLIRTKF